MMSELDLDRILTGGNPPPSRFKRIVWNIIWGALLLASMGILIVGGLSLRGYQL